MTIVPNDRLIGWVANKVGCEPEDFEPGRAAGVYGEPGELRGAAVFHGWQKKARSVSVSWAAVGKKPWLSRGVLEYLCRHAFKTLGCVRINAMVDVENRRSISILHRLGFQREGRIRLGWDGERDLLIFGMLRDECRWYPVEGKRDGQEQQA